VTPLVPEWGEKGRKLRENRTHVKLGFRNGARRWYHWMEVMTVHEYNDQQRRYV
jgi:hypothetical protein